MRINLRAPSAAPGATGANRAFFWTFMIAGAAALSVGLTGCSGKKSAFSGKGSPTYRGSGPIPQGGGVYKVGNPYWVAGKKYYPRVDNGYDKVGMASWYGPKFHRRMTANGEWFDMNRITAAHKTLPLPSFVRVTNLKNNKTIVVRVNDRGPYAHDRIIDLSKKSAELLGFKRNGTARVRVTYMGKAPLNGDDYYVASAKAGRPLHASADPTNVNVGRPVIASVQSPTFTASITPSRAAMSSPDARMYIRAASFGQQENAERLKTRLASLFGPVKTDVLGESDRPIYRVSVGPFHDDEQARKTLEGVRDEGLHDARLVTE